MSLPTTSAAAALAAVLSLGLGVPAGFAAVPASVASSGTAAVSMPSQGAPSSATPSVAPHAARWQNLPATPRQVPGARDGYVSVNGANIYYAQWGHGRPMILLHGGPANSDYLAHQVRDLQRDHRVIVIDTRGHGRSTTDGRPLGYDLFADDVVGVMDALHVRTADLVGWSDGGITALDVSMRYPERVKKVVAFGANVDTHGTFSDADKKPAFSAFLTRAESEYQALSSTPHGFSALGDQLGGMYSTQPNWTPAQLRTIKAPVLVMAGDHDEAIKPEHTRYMARTIPRAQLKVLPDTSHFAFLQDPSGFNAAVRHFLR